ncbi:3792_t:CDS:2 [Paraglomus occultum]|uniref:3792_t:CDS:1 n=1 Tax=Paraglomus occultum TaxID=144539 RepID=A0A9N9FQT0_9GLOM|nr:3792_t:CDS:2 [Paraglomus occultum]
MFRLLPRTLSVARPIAWSITSARSFSNTAQLLATVSKTKAKPKVTKKPAAKTASKSGRPSSRQTTTAKRSTAKTSTAKKVTASSAKKKSTQKPTKKLAAKPIKKKPVKKKPVTPKIKIPPLKGPKKPGNAFSLFMKDTFQEEKEKNPDMKVTEICKLAANRWKTLPEDEKLVYQDKSVQAKADFEKENQKFLESLTPLDYARENLRRRAKKEKPMKDPNLPKKPLSGFLHFAVDMMKQPEFAIEPSITQRMSAISKRWKEMNDDEKKTYVDRYAEEKAKYLTAKEVYTKQLDKLKEANPL